MQPNEKQQPYLLSENRHLRIYEAIKEQYFEKLEKPAGSGLFAVYLAAQPGSGKTILRNHYLQILRERQTVVINTDELREFHPDYKTLLAHPTNFSQAPYLVNPDASLWTSRLREDAIKAGYHLIFDSTLGGAAVEYIKSMKALQEMSYYLQLEVLVVKDQLSRLGIHLRYEHQLLAEGAGRFVNMNVHDKNYQNLIPNLSTIVGAVSFSSINLYVRKVELIAGKPVNNAVKCLYTGNNEKKDLNNKIKSIIQEERERPWSEIEKRYLTQRINQVVALIKQRDGDERQFLSDINNLITELKKQQ